MVQISHTVVKTQRVVCIGVYHSFECKLFQILNALLMTLMFLNEGIFAEQIVA